MAFCVSKTCLNYNKTEAEVPEGIALHPFPKNDALKGKWINQMNDDEFEPDETSALCSLHFIKEYFINESDSIALKPDAIPTEFEFDTPMETDDEICKCCAYKCNNTFSQDSNIGFHPFPIDQPELCDQWLLAMGVTQVAAKQAVLCSEHFDELCFVQGENGERLMIADAVPSIFIFPESSDEAPLNHQIKCEIDDALALTQTAVDLIEKHDITVNILTEESQRLINLYRERLQLEKDKRNIDFLIKTVLGGSIVDKSKIRSLDTIIRSVDSVVQQIVVDCLSPCVAIVTEGQEIQE